MSLILGIDPGLANCGWALLDSRDARIHRTGVIVTHAVERVGDMQERVSEILHGIDFAMDFPGVIVIVIEFPSAGRGRDQDRAPWAAKSASQTMSAASALRGRAHGVVKDDFILTPAPITWRCALGCKRGQDEALHQQLAARYPRTVARYRKGARPHVLDAIGLALFGRLTATNQTRRSHDLTRD